MVEVKLEETREVGIEFFNSKGQQFMIENATYTVLDTKKAQVQTAAAQVEGTKVFMLFNATTVGVFYVNFKVHVGVEVYCPQVMVRVI